jgi:protocatechuate 3,4-dioxygenase beta subunit
MATDGDGHEHGLAHDLARMFGAPMARRRALGLAAAGGTIAAAALVGRRVPALAAAPGAGPGCVAFPEETAGPYPANGTRGRGAAPPDVLSTGDVIRSDIRSSFAGRGGRAGGVPVTLTLQLVGAGRGCTPLAGYAVYLWQCDAAGLYSLYTLPGENYLRGVQVTDGGGRVTFRTVFPGAYDGRFPHMHFELYRSVAKAAQHRRPLLTSQLAMPRGPAEAIYRSAAIYGDSAANMRGLDLASDYVFGDNQGSQMAAMIPVMTGSAATGYVATAVVGVA